MNRYLVIVALVLVVISQTYALTQEELNAQDSVISQSQNKFMAAEVAQEMRTTKQEIIDAVKQYNDENFAIFDSRMQDFMKDTKTKVALGAVGAGLIANALAAYLIMRTMKRYSYEVYQEKLIGKLQEEVQEKDNTIAGMQQMQQPQWAPQQPTDTLGMVYGQSQASEMTQMNAWQAQPAYYGSWQPPINVVPEYSHMPAGYKNIDDPMQSPGWGRQDGQQ